MTLQLQPHAPDRKFAPNRIGEVAFRFDVSDASRQLGTPEKLLMAVRAELLDIIDSTLTRAADGRSDIRLEHIDIDLGGFPDPPDWQQVRALLRERLLAELAPYLYPVVAEKPRGPGRDAAVSLPNASPEDTQSDAAQASGKDALLSDADLPAFKSTRRASSTTSTTPLDKRGGSTDGRRIAAQPGQPDPARRGTDAETEVRRIFSIVPTQPESPENRLATFNGVASIPPISDISDALRSMTDAEARNRLLAELRWRHKNAPARLYEELGALSSHDLARLSRFVDTDTGPENESPTGAETPLPRATGTAKTDLIARIEHAFEEALPSVTRTQKVAEFTAILRGVFPDTVLSQPDPERLADVAEKALPYLAGPIPSDLAKPKQPAPSDTLSSEGGKQSDQPDLPGMTRADLRELIEGLLPEGAAELSTAIDQLNTTSADVTEALRVVARALLEGSPVDLEHARRAVREDSGSADAAQTSIASLLRALGASEPEITTFFHEPFVPISRRENAHSENQSYPSSTSEQQSSYSNFDPTSPISARQSHQQPDDRASRGQNEAQTGPTNARIEDNQTETPATFPVQSTATGDGGAGGPGTPEQPDHAEADNDGIDTSESNLDSNLSDPHRDDDAFTPDRIEPSARQGVEHRTPDSWAIPEDEIADSQPRGREPSVSRERNAAPPSKNQDGLTPPTDQTQSERVSPAMQPGEAASTTGATRYTAIGSGTSDTPDAAISAPVDNTEKTDQPVSSETFKRDVSTREQDGTAQLRTTPSSAEVPDATSDEGSAPQPEGDTDNARVASADGTEETLDTPLSKDVPHRQSPIETPEFGTQTTTARDPEQTTDQHTETGAAPPPSGPSNITATTADENLQRTSGRRAPSADSHGKPPEDIQSSSGFNPNEPPGTVGTAPPEITDKQAPERRLDALFDAAAASDAPRLRKMLDLIWSAMSDGAEPASRHRARYWHAALAAALSMPSGRRAREHAVAAFLTVAEPDDASRHNLLRVLLARLGYGQPGSDPALRRETCAVLEYLLSGDRRSPAKPPEPDPDTNFLMTTRAGLVIFHPYLPMLFDRMALLTPQKRIRPEQLPRAVAALAALANATPAPALPDPLERLLLAVPNTTEVAPETLPHSEISLIDSLLRSVLAQWPRLGQTSPAGLRDAFINRSGLLQTDGEAPRLLVDEGPYDMLLDGLPWALSPVALPWMTAPLTVIWRQSDD